MYYFAFIISKLSLCFYILTTDYVLYIISRRFLNNLFWIFRIF